MRQILASSMLKIADVCVCVCLCVCVCDTILADIMKRHLQGGGVGCVPHSNDTEVLFRLHREMRRALS